MSNLGAATCLHRIAISEPCAECDRTTTVDADGEIAMTPAEYTAFRERTYAMFRTPGWPAPELRILEANE